MLIFIKLWELIGIVIALIIMTAIVVHVTLIWISTKEVSKYSLMIEDLKCKSYDHIISMILAIPKTFYNNSGIEIRSIMYHKNGSIRINWVLEEYDGLIKDTGFTEYDMKYINALEKYETEFVEIPDNCVPKHTIEKTDSIKTKKVAASKEANLDLIDAIEQSKYSDSSNVSTEPELQWPSNHWPIRIAMLIFMMLVVGGLWLYFNGKNFYWLHGVKHWF